MNAMTPSGLQADRKGHPFAREAAQRWTELKSARGSHEQDWEDIARFIRPQRGGFVMDNPGDREPIQANSNAASGLYANLTNPASRWFGLETPDADANKWQPMAVWNDQVTRRVFNSFRPDISNFYPATLQAYADITAFGNSAAYDEFDQVERRWRDVTLSLAEVVWDVDAWGRVWEWLRRFRLKPRAAVKLFRGRGELPAKIHELAEKGDSTDLTFYHHITPNEDWRPGRIGRGSKPFRSIYAAETEMWLISERGYDEMPAYVPRWDVDSGQTVGTGPGFIALASARALHRMDEATIRAAQFAADPTMLAPSREDWPLNGHVRPGSTVYGGTNIRGDQMLRPLQTSGGIGLTIQEKQAKIEEIKNAFHYSVMSLSGRTGVTAEESLIMEEARLREWAPHADRIMEEYAARKVERRFRQLWRMGQLPPPPPGMEGVPLQVRYTSAAALAMRAREGVAIMQFMNNIGALSQIDPRYAERTDPDGVAEALHDASLNLPGAIMRSRESADQIAQARAQAQQAQQAAALAQQGAGALKDAAGAAALLQGGGQPQGAGQ
jgi:hypothetical protein